MSLGRRQDAGTMLGVALAVWLSGCTQEVFLNQTASRGGDTAGSAGNIDVAFINNTPFRAIFTYGTYNNTDQTEQPQFQQFGGTSAGPTLEGNAAANIVTLQCDRVFSIGDSELLRLIEENIDLDAINVADEAFVRGAAFSGANLGEDEAVLATEGSAKELRALLGVDFSCGSILIIRFEIDDLGEAPFRMDFEVIPPAESDRGV